jgi:hypothetical protein
MIYKVIDNSEALTNGVSELNKYNIYFVKGCLFISDKNNTQDFYQNIKSIFNNAEIYEINENNLAYEPTHIIEWSKKELVSADLIQYEKENQQKLRQIMQQLDKVEKELFEGSDSQCQRKNESAEDRPKTKSKSILMKVLNKLKCKNNKK